MTSSTKTLPRALIRSLVVTWILLFLLGFYGHRKIGNTTSDSLFKSLQLFHLHYHPYAEESAPQTSSDFGTKAAVAAHPQEGWELEVARFGAALYGLAILPLVLGFAFERRLHQWWVGRFWSGHYVVCGTCVRTHSLVTDLRSRGHRVVWVGRCADGQHAEATWVLRIDGDSGDPVVLANAAVHRASHLVALHEDDRLNIETLVAAGKLCQERPGNLPPLNAHAHVTDTRLEHALRNLMKSRVGFAGAKVREHLLNYYEIIARLLVRRFPIPPTLAESRPPPEHIIIIGFAAFGQCSALRILLMAQQLYRQKEGGKVSWHVAKPRITVVDPNADARIAEFNLLHPKFREFCELDSCSLSTADFQFWTQPFLTHREEGERKTIIFSIETEAETMRMLGIIAHMTSGGTTQPCSVDRVCIRIARPERLGPVIERLKPANNRPEIIYFAPDSEVFNADMILNQSQDILAREIHKAYLTVEAEDRRVNNQAPAAGKTWEELAEDDRESNREAADHLWAKLYILGYALAEIPEGKTVPPPPDNLLQEIKAKKEEMARAEHYRWMTWRILNDWTPGETRDNVNKRHPDIRDYEALGEPTKDKDRVNIRVIPELLKQGRLAASRRSERKEEEVKNA